MEINLDYSALLETVRRSLSVIGKRSTDDNGNLLFTDITVGTNEEPIIFDFFRLAINDLAAELSAFIYYADVPDDAAVPAASPAGITLELPTNVNDQLEPFIQESCEAYCVSYALYSWFTVTAPRLVKKYQGDCTRQLNALIRLIHEKQAHEAPELTYADIPASVILNS